MRASAATCGVVVFGLLLPATGHAQSRVTFVPSVSVFTVYDDNLFAREEGSAGYSLEVRPSVEGNYESPRTGALGLYSFDMQRSNHPSLNTFDARRHALASAQVRTTPVTTLGVTGRYDRTETPGEINLETGVLGARRTAERWQATPTFARRLAVRTVASASYDWTTESLIEGASGTLHVGRAGISRDIDTRTSVGATYVGRYFVDEFDDHISHAVLPGWNQLLAPGTRLSLAAGPRIRSYDNTVVPEIAAAFARGSNRLKIGIDYQHSETIVLGVPGPVAFDGGSIRLTWPTRRATEWGVHAGVSDLETIDKRETTVYRGRLVASWTPRASIYTVAASYGIDVQRGTIRRFSVDDPFVLQEGDIVRHVVRVGLTMAPRLSRSMLPPDEAARAKGVAR
jgi:hypothetical protein